MAIKTKKGTKGDAVNYMTRNAACRKLGVSLKMFRKLCILKGIHPRDPKKKLKGRTKTYYFTKDIRFLRHDPIIGVLQARKAVLKKEKKLREKKQMASLELLIKRRPRVSMDHIVKERYPTFSDALRDLDDCLTLVHLFAVMDGSIKVREQHINTCAKLAREFQSYVAQSQSLRKVFVSVKGIYYQAEIMGETVTWLAPINYINKKEKEVDYGVMISFLEFYECMLKFVNYRLFTSLGLKYPPAIDDVKAGMGEHLTAVIKQSIKPAKATQTATISKKKLNATMSVEDAEKQKKINSLKLGKAQDDEEVQEDDQEEQLEITSEGISKDFEGLDETKDTEDNSTSITGLRDPSTLFKGRKFFVSRECPRNVLEFVITSFGGEAVFENTTTPLRKVLADHSITHIVTEREQLIVGVARDLSKEYVQPQWIFDCVNSNHLLHTLEYTPGAVPPPHLSPFVEYDESSYIPSRKLILDQMINQAGFDSAIINTEDSNDMNDDDDEEKQQNKKDKKRKSMGDDEDEEDQSDDEDLDSDNEDVAAALEAKYIQELEQESTKNQPPKQNNNNNKNNKNNKNIKETQEELQDKERKSINLQKHNETNQKAHLNAKIAKKKKQQVDEELQMAEMMIRKKDKGLYHTVKNQVQKESAEKRRLEAKREYIQAGRNVDGIKKDQLPSVDSPNKKKSIKKQTTPTKKSPSPSSSTTPKPQVTTTTTTKPAVTKTTTNSPAKSKTQTVSQPTKKAKK